MMSIKLGRSLLRKRLLVTLAILLCKMSACCQINKAVAERIDSLKTALVGSAGQTRYDLLDKLAYEYVWVVDTIALPYAAEAYKMSWQFGDSARIAKSGRVLAMVLYALKEYDSTIVVSRRTLPIGRRNMYESEVMRLLNLLALAHTHKAEYDKALAYNFESLDLRKKSGDSLFISIALDNVGLVYFKIQNFIHAAEYFKKALEFRSSNGNTLKNVDRNYHLTSFVNLTVCHAYMMDLEKSEQYLMKAKKYCAASCGDRQLMTVDFASGLLQFKSGNLQGASKSFLTSLRSARKLSDPAYELDNLSYLSEISIRSNHLLQAEKYLLEAEPIFESAAQFRAEILQAYGQLSKVYTKMGRYREASAYQAKYIELREKVYNNQLTINLMTVQAEQAEKENKAKIEAQEKILALRNDIINRQRTLNIIVGIVSLLAVAFVFVLIENIRQKKRVNTLLEQRVKERTIELEENHRMLVKSMLERDIRVERISNEIRSSLATIKGLGVLVYGDLGTNSASNYLAMIEETSNNLIKGLNRISDQHL